MVTQNYCVVLIILDSLRNIWLGNCFLVRALMNSCSHCISKWEQKFCHVGCTSFAVATAADMCCVHVCMPAWEWAVSSAFRSQNPSFCKPCGKHPLPTESFRLGQKTSEIKPSLCRLNHSTKYHIQSFLEHLPGLWLHHLPGQPVPMPYNPFHEEIPPDVQHESLLRQSEAVSSCPIIRRMGAESDPHLDPLSFQIVRESDKVSPETPFLQAKNPQISQLLPIALHQTCCPSLQWLQHINVFFEMKGPELETVVESISYIDSCSTADRKCVTSNVNISVCVPDANKLPMATSIVNPIC